MNSHRINQGFDSEDIHFIEVIASQLTTAIENVKLYEKLHRQFTQVVESMADAIGKKDLYTGGHTKRVAHFSLMIGKQLELSSNDFSDLKLAAVLHDIGKIGIEDKILKKAAPLTDEEFVIMKEHPRLGYEILGHHLGSDFNPIHLPQT
ncbi:MAG: HD domain-containing protein [Flavobacteriales bacterium]|nr:HD domain-containing protein [Flavobacteriales bacterium]